MPPGHPAFGRPLPCDCIEREETGARQQRLLRYSGLANLARQSFATLNEQGLDPDPAAQERFRRAARAGRAFAANPEGWFVLAGPSGSGKTHLAAAIANDVIHRGQPALFVFVPDLLDHLRASYGPDAADPYDALLEQVRYSPLLVLDDLGGEYATPWAEEKLYQVLNARHAARMPTVLTLAVPLDHTPDRFRTRLSDATVSLVFTLAASPTAVLDDALDLPLLREMTFERFQVRGAQLTPRQSASLEQALRAARTFAEAPEGWLVFTGPTGSGKTHLAAAVAHRWRDAGRQVVFSFVPDLLDALRAAVHDDAAPDTIEAVRRCALLVLDDLGLHTATAWAQEKLFQVLNYRYLARLPTIITVGGSLEDLPPPWVSRMLDPHVSQLVAIEAPDFRASGQSRAAPPPAARRRRGP